MYASAPREHVYASLVAKSSRALRRGELNKKLIIDAALRVADAHGLEAVTMRRIGEELGASATGLYRHVNTREEIVDGLIDRALGSVTTDTDSGQPWDTQLRHAFLAIHRALLGHPGLTAVLSTQPVSTVRAMRSAEQMLAVLRGAGFAPDTAIAAVAALQSYTFGFTVQQRARTAANPSNHLTALQALPESDFPHIHELAADFGAWTTEKHFETGLDWLLAAIGNDHCNGDNARK
ncbi:TetR/AcrR family transcriptional regulator C-terminal domain-containing protein [Mycobacterium sp.]|uniref:TetR/AcrR family transcriptional regulator n=1 Tax=Mycobacterium sp. TaxID=1785 RepID=UPI0026009CF5|nr:TetR/AcrR family transcriptional regulator C-terminal domain-containing protein [Mycobacterium sp.]